MNTSYAKLDASKNEFLSFQLGAEHFCLEILKVQEIRGYAGVTTIANMPDYIKGVVNLRGEVVPILDLRIKLRLQNIQYNEFTVVIILSLQGHQVGIVVDSVSDVIALSGDQIQDLPEMLSCIETRFMTGVVIMDTDTVVMLDIEKLLDKDELELAVSESLH